MTMIEEKINIAELLKDCPKGLELDCLMYGGLEFDRVDEYNNPHYPIVCRVKTESGRYDFHTFNKYGCYGSYSYSKCVIFPKGKTTWEGFQRPFKDGDVVITTSNAICIYKSIHKEYKESNFIDYYCGYRSSDNQFVIKRFSTTHFGPVSEAKLATEEEKQKLFDAIKANGYKWNPQEKTLEKLIEPKFKVGDRVKHKESYISGVVTKIYDECYKIKYDSGAVSFANIKYQDDYELVHEKFDITTLKPFDKVLVRDNYQNYWAANLYSHYMNANEDYHFATVFGYYRQCIPYNDETKHLLGKADDCENYYKTWE